MKLKLKPRALPTSDSKLMQANVGQRIVPKNSSTNIAIKEDSNMELGALAPLPQAKPAAFIPTSDHSREKQRLSRTLGVLYPEHRNPSVEDMREGLAALSREFIVFKWIMHDGGNKFLTYFPT